MRCKNIAFPAGAQSDKRILYNYKKKGKHFCVTCEYYDICHRDAELG